MVSTCASSKEKCKALSSGYDVTDEQGSMCAEDDLSRKHRIVEGCQQEGNERACIYEWTEVISEPYGSGRDGHEKRIVALLCA